MAFTADELSNIAASALDYYFARPDVFQQTIQEKPLLAQMESKAKTFPGGKGEISVAVQFARGAGGTNDSLAGYTHDDTVNFYREANVKRAAWAWKEHHLGLEFTYTELKHDGISINDSTTNSGESGHSEREKTALVNILDNKMESFTELHAEELNALMWGDGTGDAKAMAGLTSFITDDPTTGTVGGLDRSLAAYSGWRNRSFVGVGAITSSAANGGALSAKLQTEMRQLKRFGGKPDTFLCGSEFLDAYQLEMKANGEYSNKGFTGKQDASFGEAYFGNLKLQYDPTLDDMSMAKRAYIFSSKDIFLQKMDNEWRKFHTPARPTNQFVIYKSMTSTGQMVAKRLNSSMVIEIA